MQLFFVSAGAVFGYCVGGFDGFIRALVVFAVLDYVTALALAVKEKRLSSEVGFLGIFKKMLIFALVAVANMIDNEMVSTGDMLRNAVVFFYLSNEGLSVLENCAALGLHIPDRIRMALLKIRNNKEEQKGTFVLPDADPGAGAEPSAGMTNAMYDELTNGRCADGVHEQSAYGIPSNKP